jgi:hypothetical protein
MFAAGVEPPPARRELLAPSFALGLRRFCVEEQPTRALILAADICESRRTVARALEVGTALGVGERKMCRPVAMHAGRRCV